MHKSIQGGPLGRGIFKQKEQFDPNFVESCVDFEVAHLSVLMVQRLPYPEIPTLITTPFF